MTAHGATSLPRGDGSTEPLVTFGLLAFNQERFIRAAVDGALSQDYPNIQFIFSDDASVDSTFEEMAMAVSRWGESPRVLLRRGENNLGLAAHVNEVFRLAEGEIVVLAAGDDISLPGRVSQSVRLLEANPSAAAAALGAIVIGADDHEFDTRSVASPDIGHIFTLSEFLKKGNRRVSGATRAYRSSVMSEFGDLSPSCPTEDTTLLLRSLMLGGLVQSSNPAVLYRKHDANLSGASRLHNMDFSAIRDQYLRDLELATQKGYVADAKVPEVASWIETNYAERILARRIAPFGRGHFRRGGWVLTAKGVRFRTRLRLLLRRN